METSGAIQTVGIISKPGKPELAAMMPRLVEWLEHRSIQTLLDRETAGSLDPELKTRLSSAVVARGELAA